MGSRSDSFRFATSANQETDEYYKAILDRIAAFFEKDFEQSSSENAIVLSGSLAVGEGTSYNSGGGGAEPGSDVDLYLVAPETDLHGWKERLPSLHRGLLDSIQIPGLVIDLGATSPERLGRLSPTIANCILSGEGKVIAGNPGIMPRDGALPCREVPPWDGLLLLLNRVVEELSELNPQPRGEREAREFWYRVGKTIRDLGTSALVVAGDFAPRLEERRERLPRLLEETSLAAEVPFFLDEYNFWCEQKERPRVEEAEMRYGGEAPALRTVHRLKQSCVEAFWKWESGQVLRRRGAGEDLKTFRSLEPARRRVRAWLRFVANRGASGLGPAFRHARRGFPVSPLVGNYIAAVCLLRSWGHLAGDAPDEDDRRHLRMAVTSAPHSAGAGGTAFERQWAALREAVCCFWSDEVMGGTRPPKRLEKV